MDSGAVAERSSTKRKIFLIADIKLAIARIERVDFNLEDFHRGKKKGMNPLPPSELYQNEDKSSFKCRAVLGIKRRKVSFRVHVRLWKCQSARFLPAPSLSALTRAAPRLSVSHAERCGWLCERHLFRRLRWLRSRSLTQTGFNFCVITFISTNCSSEARVHNDTLWTPPVDYGHREIGNLLLQKAAQPLGA